MSSSIDVLVVDDDYRQAEMLQEFLHVSGSFNVKIVDSLAELWNCLARNRYDIVLLDHMLPDGTGLSALPEFSERGHSVPVVMVTGQGDEQIAARAIQSGAADYIVKSDDYLVTLPPLIRKTVRSFDLERSMQHSLEKIRYQAILLNNVRDAVVVWDMEGRITYWSPAAEGLFGWKAAEREGEQVSEVYLQAFNPPARLPRLGDSIGYVERQIQTQHKRNIWVSSRVTPLFDGNRPIGYMDVSHDITKRKQAEQALRAERNFVSAVLDTVGALVVVTDREGRIVRFNRACERVTGYSFTEVRGKHLWDLFIPKDEVAATRHFFRQAQAGHLPSEFETNWVTRSGRTRLITWANTAIRSYSGAVEYVITTGIDITEQRQTEEALRTSEARYRAIVEDYQTELICRFLPDGRLTFVNQAYCRYFHAERDELIGTDFLAVLPDAERARMQQHLADFSPQNPIDTIETQIRLPGGELRWNRWTSRAIFGEGGRLLEFQAIGHDMTERRQAQEALKASERHIRSIYEAVASGVIVYDQDGVITRANQTACDIMQTRLEDLLGKKYQHPKGRVYHEDGSLFVDSELPFNATSNSGQPVNNVVMGIAAPRSNRLAWILVNSAPLFEQPGGALKEVVVTLVDITERKEMESQIQAAQTHLTQAARLATIGELASGVAHQINNPLTTIIAEAQILQRKTTPDDEVRDSVDAIEEAGWRLQEAVQRLVEFSRPATGTLEELSVNQTIQQALLLVGAQIEAVGIQILSNLEEGLEPVHGNRRQLEDLWVNLLLLARDAAVGDRPHQIHIQSQRGANGWIIVRVRDNGEPIPPDRLDAVFEPDFVGPTSGRGTGMELSICREIVRQHNGRIWAELSPEHDTILCVALPAVSPDKSSGE